MSKEFNRTIVNLVMAIGVVALVAFLVFCIFALKGEETYTSNSDADYTIGFLDCRASDVIDPFFVSDAAMDFYHEIKITFSNNNPDKIFYNYFGKFSSYESAETENARLHADYNKYMGKRVDPNVLTPNFSRVDNTVSVNLYSAIENLSSITGKFFFLDSEDMTNLGRYSRDDFTLLYEVKGFSCKTDE